MCFDDQRIAGIDTQPLAVTERTLRIVLMNLHHLAAIPAPSLGGFIDDM